MTPLRFERLHQDEWAELATLLDQMRRRRTASSRAEGHVAPDRVAALYRRTCEHLALARARAYPAHILDRLETLTSDAHQAIYRDRVFGLGALRRLITVDFPRAVRRDAGYIWVAALTFGLPLLVMGLLVYDRPELILSIVSPDTAAGFEEMYSPASDALGRTRTADTDWMMFGYYIRNNISVAFQCFAGGLFAGVGSLFFLGYNGAFGGAIAGYLTERGLSSTFYSFVATHSSFELTAIVLSGGAGLKIGHALLAPGRRSRRTALVEAAAASATVLYGVTVLLVVAAAFEAFWSSATWISPSIKYTAAAVCWTAVIVYLTRQGRHAG
jgi:uncharacterized membrane protein SpoIIM required for sporulation